MTLTDDTPGEWGNALTRLLDRFVAQGLGRTGAYVDGCRDKNPGGDANRLALRIVGERAFKSGLLGAATGFGGFITMPIAVPVGAVLSWKIQISTILAIAHVYGRTADPKSLLTDVYLILARDSKMEGIRQFGTTVEKGFSTKDVSKYVTKAGMAALSKKIIKKKIRPTPSKFLRAVPLLGAPVGFIADWRAARALGRTAIKYYAEASEV